jgi:WD40 repeat protein
MRRLLPGVTVLLALFAAIAAQEKGEAEPENEPEETATDEPIGNLLPMQNVGGHTARINDLVFDRASKRLYTAGPPGELAEWDVESGERLRLWRFPRPVERVAVFPDRQQLAVVVRAVQSGKGEKIAVWTIDLAKGEATLRKVLDFALHCHSLAIAPAGDRLALGVGNNAVVLALDDKGPPAVLTGANLVRRLAFDRSGRSLLLPMGRQDGKVRIWNLPGKDEKGKPSDVTLAGGALHTPQAAWSADGDRVIGIGGGKEPALAVWNLSKSKTKPDRKWGPAQLGFSGSARSELKALGVASLSADKILAAWAHDRSLKLVSVDLKTDRVEPLPTTIHVQSTFSARMAVSADGRWLAVTTRPAFRVALYDLQNKKEGPRLGPTTHVPRAVAWTPKGYGIAWGYQPRPGKNDGKAKLNEGLDMGKLEPLSLADLAAAQVGARPAKRTLSTSDKGKTYLVRGTKKVPTRLKKVLPRSARLYKDASGVERLIVAHGAGRNLSIVDLGTGKIIAAIGGLHSRIHDVAVSPDQKYVLVAGGGMDLEVFSLARPQKPLLRLMPGWRGKAELAPPAKPLPPTTRPGGDWVAWTEQGYYAGTPGGEKLFGWKVVSAPDKMAVFQPATRYSKQLHRRDLIQLVLPTGSVEAALKQLGKETTDQVEEMQPPTVVIEKVDVNEKVNDTKPATITVKVKATGSGPKQPVMSMRLMLNGRPLPEKKFQVDLKTGKAMHTQSWTVEVPDEGKYELSVLARGPDSLGVSQPREVTYKKPPTSRLFALCIGVNSYVEKKINLTGACNDARAIAGAMKKHCGKPLFASAKADVLLDDNATKKGVLKALADLRASAPLGVAIKPSDLVVLFFAGHGVKEKGNFYLLPHDADLKNLPKSCISGDELRKELSQFRCQVLLLLDACHSGSVAGALTQYQKATDDLTRTMTAEEVGVAVLAAAMGHEHALEKNNRGHFARALEEAIQKKEGVPVNFRDKHVYVHHLFSYAFDRVKDLSGDEQHPSLNLPDTVESFPVAP